VEAAEEGSPYYRLLWVVKEVGVVHTPNAGPHILAGDKRKREKPLHGELQGVDCTAGNYAGRHLLSTTATSGQQGYSL